MRVRWWSTLSLLSWRTWRCSSSTALNVSRSVCLSSTTLGGGVLSSPLPVSNVLALDFDGVLCASAEESSATAVQAAVLAWGLPMSQQSPKEMDLSHRVRGLLQQVRPVIESGFENVLLARYFFDVVTAKSSPASPLMSSPTGEADTVDDQLVAEVMRSWSPNRRDELLGHYGRDRQQLVDLYASVRDDQIARDFDAWVSRNKVYPHVLRVLTCGSWTLDPQRVLLITTKQERFLRAILNRNGLSRNLLRDGVLNSDSRSRGLPLLQRGNVFDLENVLGNKRDVLREVVSQLVSSSTASESLSIECSESASEIFNPPERVDGRPVVHFVEDRFETLRAIVDQRRANPSDPLHRVRLYLVDWGYNTAEQRRRAATEFAEEISLLDATGFEALLHRFSK